MGKKFQINKRLQVMIAAAIVLSMVIGMDVAVAAVPVPSDIINVTKTEKSSDGDVLGHASATKFFFQIVSDPSGDAVALSGANITFEPGAVVDGGGIVGDGQDGKFWLKSGITAKIIDLIPDDYQIIETYSSSHITDVNVDPPFSWAPDAAGNAVVSISVDIFGNDLAVEFVNTLKAVDPAPVKHVSKVKGGGGTTSEQPDGQETPDTPDDQKTTDDTVDQDVPDEPGDTDRPDVPDVIDDIEIPLPGGNDSTVHPNPNVQSSRMVPDGGGFLEIGEDGVPLGRWDWDDEQQMWIFDEDVPLIDWTIPQTGLMDDSYNIIVLLAMALTMLCIELLVRDMRKRKLIN